MMQSMLLELWLRSMLAKVLDGDYESLQDLRKELEAAIHKLETERISRFSREEPGK